MQTVSDNGILIASCTELRSEISSVLKRPKISRFISSVDINKVIEFHDLVTTVYKPGKILPVSGDLKDDYLFALGVKCKADYLVTGDKLLLNVTKYKNIDVISFARFKELLK